MTLLERSTFIHATLEAIDQVAMDCQSWPQWYPGVQEATPDDVYPEVGGKISIAYKAAGLSFTLTFTLVDYAFGETVAYDIAGMMSGNTRYILEPQGDGVQMTARFDYNVPGGGLGKIADKLVIERMNAENLEKSLANMKAILEG
ncbi:MAG: SRPBCC family protein [Anaerolineaceae bacterium]|nr:SRPBCC family protein [Anaerolineaceae bacterium]